MLNPAEWAWNYDDFCNNMSKRLFFPLTEEAQKDPVAMAEWRASLKQEDKELERRAKDRKYREDLRKYR